MEYYDKEQIEKAREIDLLTYLQRYEPDELFHDGGNSYHTRSHDSLKMSNGLWCWWSHGISGRTALDYLTQVRGLGFTEAVKLILRDSISAVNQIYVVGHGWLGPREFHAAFDDAGFKSP